MIPRPETEHLIVAAIESGQKLGRSPLRIVDVGTGSGCIAVTLAKQIPSSEIIGLDISADAIRVAQSNLELHQVQQQVTLIESDLFAALPAGFQPDIIVSNPPYVGRNEVGTLDENVKSFEPDLALFGGDEGTEIIERLIEQAASRLDTGGFLIFEFSPMIAGKCKSLVEEQGGFESVDLQKDYSGHERLIVAKRG